MVDESERIHWKALKIDSNGLINSLQIEPSKKSHLLVPLCRLVVMDAIRGVGKVDVQRLESCLGI